jgi:hypothetical protein
MQRGSRRVAPAGQRAKWWWCFLESVAEMLAVPDQNTSDGSRWRERRQTALRRSARLVLLLVGTFLFGCGQSSDTAQTASGGASGATPTGSSEPKGPGLRGVLSDESGEIIGESSVLACMATVCLFGKSESDGHFVFAIEPPANVALKTPEDMSVTPRRGALLLPVRMTEPLHDVGAVRVPNLPPGVPLLEADVGTATYELGDGLTLTLASADLTPRLGDKLRDLAARKIRPEHVRPMAELDAERVVAVYAIHPFAATSSSPIAVQASSSLPSGTAVKFRTVSELDGQLSEPVAGVADGDVVRTAPGTGIVELTWLVISQ